jgi:Putative peptidoglycan binding domain
MEGREGRDPGYDDWFDEPEPPTETQSGVAPRVHEDAEEVWVLPEEEDSAAAPRHHHREFVVGGRTLTTTQLVIIAASLLAIVFAILAAAGVFNGKSATPPPATVATHPATTAQTATTATTTSTTPAPEQTLKPGDTGAQVKTLQHALTTLGYPVTADGDYGPATEAAVVKFQAANKLDQDGVVGPQTLAALQQALSG